MSHVTLFTPDDQPGDEGPLTVAQVVELYVRNLQARIATGDYSHHAFEDAKRELQRFAASFGKLAMPQCRRHDLTRWLALNPQWKSKGTQKRVLATILRCFNWAEEEELIERTPYKRPRSLRYPPTPRRPATRSEVAALMRHTSTIALRRALFFLRRTGARTCEMRQLLWSQVDLEVGGITLADHKTVQATGMPRLIGLEPAVHRFLRNLHRKRREGQDHVFLNCDGTPWDRHTFARHLRRTAKRIGLDEGVAKRVSAYCLRHLFVCEGLEKDVGARQLADQTGHAKTDMINWYGRQTRQMLEHLKRIAAAVMRRSRKPPSDPRST